MPDAVAVDAFNVILEYRLLGAVCVLLIALLVWRERTYRTDLKAWQDLYKTEQQTHLDDVKAYAEIGESVRDQLKTTVTVIQTTVEWMKERGKP